MDVLAWKVFDTSTGKVVAGFTGESGSLGNQMGLVVDPVNWKMYRLMQGEWTGFPTIAWGNRERQFKEHKYKLAIPDPQPAGLEVIDLATSKLVAKASVPDAVTGMWEEDRDPDPNGNLPVLRTYIPGFAISQDGSEIAVASATNDSIALVDTKTMWVSRTVTMHEKTSLLDHLFSLLPLAPQTASAKGNSGVARFASFSADGGHLYVSGWEGHFDEIESTQVMHGQGLDVVDLKDGTITSHLLDGASVYRVVETPDDGTYVVGYDYGQGDLTKTLIARVDRERHDVMAKRTFETYIDFVIAANSQA
jgi:DNA-binding beta-propeller fold protein YncE